MSLFGRRVVRNHLCLLSCGSLGNSVKFRSPLAIKTRGKVIRGDSSSRLLGFPAAGRGRSISCLRSRVGYDCKNGITDTDYETRSSRETSACPYTGTPDPRTKTHIDPSYDSKPKQADGRISQKTFCGARFSKTGVGFIGTPSSLCIESQ